MKKRLISNRLTALKTLAGSFALLALMVLVLLPSAHAALPANTQITNSATLNYNDGAGSQTATSSVTVTIALVRVAPTVPTGSGGTTPYTAANTTLSNSFVVVAQSNGPDEYSLTPAITGSSNTTGPSVDSLGNVWLGASTVFNTALISTTTTIYVPSDGTADSEVNRIAADDWVVIGANTAVQVDSVTDPGGSGIATIVLKTALSGAPATGVPVREQVTVYVTANSGTIQTTGTSIVLTKNLTVASVADPTKTVTSGDVTDTYTSGLATFTKYVRNVTNAVVGVTALQFPVAGPTYYRTGVTAQTGEVLEYLIVVENSGTGSISSCVVTDSLPVTYSNFNTTPYSGSTAVTYYNESDVASYLTAAGGDDAALWASPTLTVNVGTGAGIVGVGTGGSIIAGKLVHVLYQVTVK